MEEKKKPGKPKHVPTEESRALVKSLYAAGIPYERVCKHIGVNIDTLCKYYRAELDLSVDKMISVLAGGLYQDALNGDKSSREFWLKTRARWSYAKPAEDEKPSRTDTLLEQLVVNTAAKKE